MKESDNGFSFGIPLDPSVPPPFEGGGDNDTDNDAVEAIEVSGEPVSRNEAKNMGLVNYDSRRETKSATTKIRLDQLPPDIDPKVAKKLEMAWAHLKRNETEEALTLAQEVVWDYPTLVAAKLVIARCFINRKEYEKALAILQVIPDEDKNAECYYYIGLCQSRLGRIKDAIDTLKQCRSTATDALIRKRSNDLLQHLQGEKARCPVCGKKTLYDSMVEVGGQTVCANCAKSGAVSEDDEEEYEDDDISLPPGKRRRRKRLRPPLTKTDILMRLMLFVFLLCLAAFGMYILHMLSPTYYGMVRSYLPDSWHFLPNAPSPRPGPSQPSQPEEPPIVVIPTMVFGSNPIESAVVGVELHHQLRIDGMEGTPGEYVVSFIPQTTGPFRIDAASGEFVWTPGEGDAGQTFEIGFTATFKNKRSQTQFNQVKVSSGPEFRRLGPWPDYNPAAAQFMIAEDFLDDPHPELVLVSGEYWRGKISILGEEDDGRFSEKLSTSVGGHPAGAGIIMAGGEKWVAVADFWNSRIRYFSVRNGSLSEMAVTIELPGQPVLADFDRDMAISAVLCRVGTSMKVVAYRQEGQLRFTKIGEWNIAQDDAVWRRLMILPAEGDSLPSIALLGSDIGTTVMMLDQGTDIPRSVRTGQKGVVVDGFLQPDGGAMQCLVENDEGMRLVTVNLAPLPGRNAPSPSLSVGMGPLLGGLYAARLGGGVNSDVVALSTNQAAIVFAGPESGYSPAGFWPLPTPARVFGKMIDLPKRKGRGSEVTYVDADGELWAVGLAD